MTGGGVAFQEATPPPCLIQFKVQGFFPFSRMRRQDQTRQQMKIYQVYLRKIKHIQIFLFIMDKIHRFLNDPSRVEKRR